MVCPACGTENRETSRFCGACGARLEAADETRQERKVVTALFADIVGFTGRSERLDPEDVRATLTPVFARVRTELERFGGTVEKFIGDAVMALFGAPTAHEDDPERAVRAAIAIRDALGEMNEDEPGLDLHIRIGVNTGEALVALDARPAEGEGLATGDVVNTAARLQAVAPVDGILVGEKTFRGTSHAIRYEVCDPVEAKGKAEPVLAWLAVEPRARLGVDVARTMEAALVGRHRELAILVDALARVRADRNAELVTLVGEPGIGKSRLVAELFRIVDEDVEELVVWRQGRCLPYGDGVSLWALGEMVKAEAGILETDPDDAAAIKLARSVAALVDEDEVDWVVRHLRPLVGLGAGSDLPAEGAGDEARAAWRRFLEALADHGPAVLVFEDLHWADDGLLDFVDELADRSAGVPLLIVCTARPELLARRPSWGGGKPNATTLSLPPLSDEETARLLAELLERSVLPADMQAALLARAGGNPLYAEEFARLAADPARAADPDRIPMPETVQGIIAARLDALDPDDKTLLQEAAVIGKVFWLGAVAAVSGRDRRAIEDRLHELERRRFVRRERRSSVAGETEYAFLHLLVRDVAYGQIPRARRAETHRAAAGWAASLGGQRGEDRAELLAHHYLSAIELGRAAGRDVSGLEVPARLALRAAGDRAVALFASPAAVRHYAAAVDLWPEDDPERPNLLLRYGRALWFGHEEGVTVLDEARDGLASAGDVEGAAEAEMLIGDLLLLHGQGDASEERFERASAMLEGRPPTPLSARVLSHIARIRMLAGRHREAIDISRRVLEIAEALGIDDVRAMALNSLGTARASMGDAEGRSDIERSIAIAERVHAPWEWSRGIVNLAFITQLMGDLDRAAVLHERGLDVAQRFRNAPGIRWGRAERAMDRYLAGNWPAALADLDAFLAEADAGSPHYMDGVLRSARAWIRLTRDDVDGALADSSEGLAAARGVRDPQALYSALGERSRLLLVAGRRDEAVAAAEEVIRAAAGSLDDPLLRSFWLLPVAIVLEAVGRGRAASDEADRGLPTPWNLATKAWAGGDPAAASEVLGRMGARGEEAFARLTAATRLAEEGRLPEARVALAPASAFYRNVGSGVFVRELESRLAEPA
jgi:class 3 adenylate cyclase/tetratricopeptide (TPR) repeat protein